MTIFSWIVLGLAGLLFGFSAVCWLLSVVMDDRDWRRLGAKTARLALVPVLFYINVVIYSHIVTGLT